MSKPINIIFALVAIGIGLYLASHHRDEAQKPQVVQTPSQSPVESAPATLHPQISTARPAAIKSLPVHATNATQIDERFTKVPKDQIVDFKVVNGLAVAYGDTVLGKPGPNFDQHEGLTEIRRTQTWKSNEIPYLIDDSVKSNTAIAQAIQLFQTRTNLRFIPFTGQEDAIVFTLGKENCMSYLGRLGGVQPIYLEPRCGQLEIAHEMMHAMGFPHEQSRTDRDQFVSILWQNIQEPYYDQFAMIPEALMDVYGDTGFDPSSILMYDSHIFSVDPKAETMKLKNGAQIEKSPTGLSDIDVQRINRLYRN